jgi:hypothetical protein
VPEPPATKTDPFGPWPVGVPADSSATLFDTFLAARPSDVVAVEARQVSDLTALPPADLPAALPAASTVPWVRAETGPIDPDSVILEDDPRARSASAVGPNVAAQRTGVADWSRTKPAIVPALTITIDAKPDMREVLEARPSVPKQSDSRRWVRLLVIGVLAVLTTASAVYWPHVWVLAYERLGTNGRVTVESAPPGAIITVDGQVRGDTPVVLRLQPGDHQVEVQLGGSARSRHIKVRDRGETTETFTLPEAGARGGFRITTYPSAGRITIDGTYRGDAPLKVTDLEPGTHTLVVETNLGAQEQDVIVRPGAVLQLAVPTASWVKADAPFDLTVLEDGRMLGNTASGPVLIRPGRHNLEFVNKELGVKLRQFIDAAPSQIVTAPLELPTGMMNVYADQAAEVFVDGERVGETPLPSLQLPLGAHDVVVRHPKYGEVRFAVRVTLAAPVNLSVTFRR